jgi:hypothetical protein
MIRCILPRTAIPIGIGLLKSKPDRGDLVRSTLAVYQVLGTLLETDEVLLAEIGATYNLPTETLDGMARLEPWTDGGPVNIMTVR